MIEEWTITKKINKRKVSETNLDRQDIGLVFEGLIYARVRNSIPKRKEAYAKLLKKLKKLGRLAR